MTTQETMLGSWNQLKREVMQRWGQLTDDELQEVEGNIEQLIGLVQQKTGEARQHVERIISKLNEDAGGAFRQAAESVRPYADQFRERGRESYDEAERMVRRRPAESVAVAFGTGLVVGLIVGLVASSRNR